MLINIRQEIPSDYIIVENLIAEALVNENISEERKHFLVKDLRNSNSFIPELSLVATISNKIVGHILFMPIKIVDINNNIHESLALASVSVHLKFEKESIESELVIEGLKTAEALGFGSVVVWKHKDYYSKFGFEPAVNYNIVLPSDAPRASLMIFELKWDALKMVSGTVIYPAVFSM